MHELLKRNCNIACTHALFKLHTAETIELIKQASITLILDETINPIEIIDITSKDIDILFEAKAIEISNDNKIVWLQSEYNGKFEYVMNLAQKNNLYIHNNVLIYLFPIEIFRSFAEIYILTYMFEYQLQKYYFDLHGVDYEFIGTAYDEIKKSYMFTEVSRMPDSVRELQSLIEIYNDKKLDKILKSNYDLSASWFKRQRDKADKIMLKSIKNSIYNHTKNIFKATANEILWTCYCNDKEHLKKNGYTKSFLAYNTRATNLYQERSIVIYVPNVFVNPCIVNFFEVRGIKINQDGMALSDLWQFIFRSRIRQGQPIKVLIFSRRMRKLLIKELERLRNYE